MPVYVRVEYLHKENACCVCPPYTSIGLKPRPETAEIRSTISTPRSAEMGGGASKPKNDFRNDTGADKVGNTDSAIAYASSLEKQAEAHCMGKRYDKALPALQEALSTRQAEQVEGWSSPLVVHFPMRFIRRVYLSVMYYVARCGDDATWHLKYRCLLLILVFRSNHAAFLYCIVLY